MSGRIQLGEGEADKEGNIVTWWDEKGPDGKPAKMKHVMSPVVKDAWTYRFIMTGEDGKDLEFGVITFTRKK